MIRRARPDDAEAAKDLITRAYEPWKAVLPDLPDVSAGLAEEIKGKRLWVAEFSGQIVGVLNASKSGDAFHIMNVAVDPSASGQGHARSLLAHAVSVALNLDCHRMLLSTHADMTGNVDMYEHMGWSVIAQEDRKIMMQYDIAEG